MSSPTPHNPRKYVRRIPWEICVSCGLVYLRNNVTMVAIKQGCDKGDN